ncbi:MAG: hypothetical protein NZ959_04105 [Armatimonadetes bacterium]|nr:hypothetical protein [Armatimonadota bacterium]MDW8121457.1 hypothetical protein [Armatimonadota bacterium]
MTGGLKALERLLHRTGGLLPLRPTYVRRFYRDGGRLPKPADSTIPTSKGLFVPERWIASCVEATNPDPIPMEGLSKIRGRGSVGKMTLKEALSAFPDLLLGPDRAAAHQGEFRLLVKILDPDEPIVFHFHAKDEDVAAHPEFFPNHRFGKEEAYYFLDAPKGVCPYSHIGLLKGVGPDDLVKAIEQGRDRLLELSHYYLQRTGEGYYTAAGVPHRPGTALCLEVQQPSDVYTLLETKSDGRPMAPEQVHPGFSSLHQALSFIDYETSQDPDLLEKSRLVPYPVEGSKQKGGLQWWIFPPRVTDKFSGKLLVVTGRYECQESDPYALLVWKGRGTLNSFPIKAGDEVFVGWQAATHPHVFEAVSQEPLEIFQLFGQALAKKEKRSASR